MSCGGGSGGGLSQRQLALFRSDDSDHNRTLSRADVAFEVKDLLPGTKFQASVRDRNGETWPKPGCLQVRVPVAIVPCLFVTITGAGWDQPVQQVRQVFPKSGLELNGADGRRTADVEYVRQA